MDNEGAARLQIIDGSDDMSVYTTVTMQETAQWLADYDIGMPVELEGIASGIENTNYFLTTDRGRFVLTIFEKLTSQELSFYLDLLAHLAYRGVPCPGPVPRRAGGYLGTFKNKPACLSICLPGRSILKPTVYHCAQVGEALARLHLAGNDFNGTMDNPRGPHWWTRESPRVLPLLDDERAALLRQEVVYQAGLAQAGIPRGFIHADLFRDNVLFENNEMGGMIDFYFACKDCLLYDLAITVNDWCTPSGQMDQKRMKALLSAYHHIRPLTSEEHAVWLGMLRAGALRFWLSRLLDFYFPRPGDLTHAKDPGQFERLLRYYISRSSQLSEWWV